MKKFLGKRDRPIAKPNGGLMAMREMAEHFAREFQSGPVVNIANQVCPNPECKTHSPVEIREDAFTGEIWMHMADRCQECDKKFEYDENVPDPPLLTQQQIISLFGEY